jgi:dihydrofolate synthase/folylpolyglutamate synthase
MEYRGAIDYLDGLGHETLAMKLGLDSIRRLAHAGGDPQLKFPAVHIAGTNGKGSTSAMVAAIATEAGLRAGLYTSPHLVEISERIRVDGRAIAAADFARLATAVRETGERLVAAGELPAPPTFFEQVTAIGYLYFAEQEVDLAVLEVGLGGRLDATNICAPLVTAITPVGADHQQYLGETLGEIAGEKAGIIKPGIPVISAPQPPEADQVIRARAASLDAPLTTMDSISEMIVEPEAGERLGFYRLRCRTATSSYDVRPNLRGRHQATNAAVAILIAESLAAQGLNVSHRAILDGIQYVSWPGRLEMIEGRHGKPLLLDGAHNPDGARKLRAFLDEHHAHQPITLIFGAMSDKALNEMAEILFPIASTIIATAIPNPRALAPERIAELAEGENRRALIARDIPAALELASAETPPDGLSCACGSLYLIGEIKSLMGNS